MSVGYGADLSCVDGLVTGRLIGGKRLIAEALYRRLTTPRGTLAGDGEESVYGFDIAGYIGSVADSIVAAALPSLIEAELLKDDRVSIVRATSTREANTAKEITFTISIDVTPIDDTEDFTLTLSADDVSVRLLGVTA